MTVWKKIKETEHGTLFRTEKGTVKVQLHCSKCGCIIESRPKRSAIDKIYCFKWINEGNPYAVCSNCDPRSNWIPIRR